MLLYPMMSDPFGTNTWFYVFRQQPGHEKVTQQTLTLTFNSSGVLTNIDKPALTAEVSIRKKRSMSAFFISASSCETAYFSALFCPLATQLFRVSNQRPIDFYPIAIVDPIVKLSRAAIPTLFFARSISSRSARRPLATIACSTVAPSSSLTLCRYCFSGNA
jgi:hypothetical protein